jgi:hypothetical protein
MTDEKSKQVALQCRAVAHLAKALTEVYTDYETMFASGNYPAGDAFVEHIGSRTAALMETLGDILNGMDAVEDEDAWMEPVFKKAHDLWPTDVGGAK